MKVSSSSEFIESVFLKHEYDPRRAHEYYLRTRKLKGRLQRDATPNLNPAGRTRGASALAPRALSRKSLQKTPEQHRLEAHERVEALKARLETLRKVLAELVQLAQARSGQDETKTSTPSTSDSKLTPTQKKVAAEASRKYYEEHKNDTLSPSEQLEVLQSKVKAVEAKIQEMREKLNSSVRTTDSVGVRLKKR